MTAAQITKNFAEAGPIEEAVFMPGIYELDCAVEIVGKNDLTISGEGAVIKTYYDRANGGNPETKSIDGFHITGCRNLTVRKMHVESALPTNVCGTIVSVAENSATVRLDEGQSITGDEKIVSGGIYDAEKRSCGWIAFDREHDPDSDRYKYDRIMIGGEVTATNPPSQAIPCEYLGDRLYRFNRIRPVEAEHIGDRCCLSYSYYGIVAFVFRACENVLMEDIEIPNFGGMGVVVFPRCKDFTFRRLKFQNPDSEHHFESLQSDGLHLVGLSGKLLIEDCIFDCLSDDPLNIHTQINTVTEADGNELKICYNKVKGVVYTDWAREGDHLRILDPATCQVKGTATVRAFSNADLSLSVKDADCEILKGDWIVNDFYFVDCEIRGSKLLTTRGGFKLRSVKKAWIHDNEIVKTGSGMHVSLGYNTLEGGPASDVLIENNVFRDAGRGSQRQIYAGLYPADDGKTRHLQQGLTVRGNRFVNNQSQTGQIICCSTDNILIENNIFENCTHPDVITERCENVTVRNNRIK